MDKYDATWAKQFIKNHCIERSRPDRPIIAANGKKNSWQLFLRRGLYNARFATVVGQLLVDQIEARFKGCEFQLAGLETAAVPVLMAIELEYLKRGRVINVFSIRKEPKNYGIFNRFEGTPDKRLVTVLVDDVVNSGASIKKCQEILAANGFMCMEDVYCVVHAGSDPDVHSICTIRNLEL